MWRVRSSDLVVHAAAFPTRVLLSPHQSRAAVRILMKRFSIVYLTDLSLFKLRHLWGRPPLTNRMLVQAHMVRTSGELASHM